MYGVLVGRPSSHRRRRTAHDGNIRHQAAPFHEQSGGLPLDAARRLAAGGDQTFLGYRRSDGQVGTRNYWLVVPLVFCENKNIQVLKQAFEEELGFAAPQIYRQQVAELARLYREGKSENRDHAVAAQMRLRPSAAACSKTSTASAFCCTKAGAAERGRIPTISAD